MSDREPEHEKRLQQQIAQYANVEDMHAAISDINAYWKQMHHRQRFREATGAQNHIDFYAERLRTAAEATGFCRVLSVGSGDGAVEMQVAKRLEALGINDYEFHLVEISPRQNERAHKNAKLYGIKGRIVTVEADLNKWVPTETYSGVMAHHSLHHVQELEFVFDQVYSALSDQGCFVTFDIIGRNGHLRWPETYSVVNALWHFLPDAKKQHTVLGWTSKDYRDHDCSTQGFEGIRAQDILPELMTRFSFDVFFAWGGLTDVFVGRGYGANFDPTASEDRRIIDLVDELNEVLIDIGAIKPTNLCASMVKFAPQAQRLYRNRTPEAMCRNPDEPWVKYSVSG